MFRERHEREHPGSSTMTACRSDTSMPGRMPGEAYQDILRRCGALRRPQGSRCAGSRHPRRLGRRQPRLPQSVREAGHRDRGHLAGTAPSFSFGSGWSKPVVLLVDEGIDDRARSCLPTASDRSGSGRSSGKGPRGAALGGRFNVLSDGSILYVAAQDVLVDGARTRGPRRRRQTSRSRSTRPMRAPTPSSTRRSRLPPVWRDRANTAGCGTARRRR